MHVERVRLHAAVPAVERFLELRARQDLPGRGEQLFQQHELAPLQRDRSLRFHATDNEHLLCYSKRSRQAATPAPSGQPDDLLLMVVNLSTYEVRIGVPEAYADDVGPGTKAEILVEGKRWVIYGLIQAEELGITSQNVDEFLTSEDPVVRRLLGVEGELGAKLGLSNDFVYRAIKLVGNYGEIFERNLGPFGLTRGQNALWTEGGLMYSPPFR